MSLKKIPILLPLILFSFFKPTGTEFIITGNSNSNRNYPLNIDSLNTSIKKGGWNSHHLEDYYFYLVNSESDLKDDLKKLSELPGDSEKSFLMSIILKREQKYEEMFNKLFSVYSRQQNFLPYYDELVFAASTTEKLLLLGDSITLSGLNSKNKNYLLGLIHSATGESQKASVYFKAALEKDSTNNKLVYKIF